MCVSTYIHIHIQTDIDLGSCDDFFTAVFPLHRLRRTYSIKVIKAFFFHQTLHPTNRKEAWKFPKDPNLPSGHLEVPSNSSGNLKTKIITIIPVSRARKKEKKGEKGCLTNCSALQECLLPSITWFHVTIKEDNDIPKGSISTGFLGGDQTHGLLVSDAMGAKNGVTHTHTLIRNKSVGKIN